MDLLRKLAFDQNAAVIAVTHDEKIFDRMFMLATIGWRTSCVCRTPREPFRGHARLAPIRIWLAERALVVAWF
jgi:hypothetical protein